MYIVKKKQTKGLRHVHVSGPCFRLPNSHSFTLSSRVSSQAPQTSALLITLIPTHSFVR